MRSNRRSQVPALLPVALLLVGMLAGGCGGATSTVSLPGAGTGAATSASSPASDGPATPGDPAASGSPATGEVVPASKMPALRATVVASAPMRPAEAVTRLAKARITVKGTPEAALSWRDENTLNILLITLEKTGPLDKKIFTTRAYLAGGLEQADGGRLRDQIVDSGDGPCDVDGGTDFTEGSFGVTDHDGDGHTEVTAGWVWGCRGDPGPVLVSLTMFTRGKHYVLKGYGQTRAEPLPAPFNQDVDPVEASAVPPQAQWPAGLHAPTLALFDSLYL